MYPTIAAGPAETAGTRSAATGTARTLLMAGVLAGPVFYLVFVAQLFIRPGFDIRRHAISLLSLGDLGWIQITSFIVTGLLGIVCAAGVRRALHPGPAGTWGPILVGLWGIGLIAAGLFTVDPGLGFPPGAPVAASSDLSWHAMLHGAAFFTAFTSSTAACFVFVRRFAGLRQWGWVTYSAVSGVAAPALVAVGMSDPLSRAGIAFAVAGAVAFGWISLLAYRLRTELTATRA